MPRGQTQSPFFSRRPLVDRRALGKDIRIKIKSGERYGGTEELKRSSSYLLIHLLKSEVYYEIAESIQPGSGLESFDYVLWSSANYDLGESLGSLADGMGYDLTAHRKHEGQSAAKISIWTPEKSITKIDNTDKAFYIQDTNKWVTWSELCDYVRNQVADIVRDRIRSEN